jgi:hypothetical protein
MLTLLSSGQGQSGTYVELMLQAYKLRVYAEAGVFEAEECLKASLNTLDNYQVDPDAQLVRNYATRVRADGGEVEGFESTITSIKNLNNSDLYDKASLSLFPSGVKAGKAYSILPINGDGDFDIIRNTIKTRKNRLGLIETVAVNVPSLNYDSVGGTPSLLLEPQRTNLVRYSSDLSNALWSKNTCIVTFNQGAAPDGTNTAVKIVRGGGNDVVTNNYYNGAELNHSRSIWAKTITGTGVVALMSLQGNANNLFTITNQWQRFELNSYIAAGSPSFYAVDFRATETTLSEILVWQPQAEVGSYASSEIFTQDSAVTRNADLISKNGISDLINSQDCTFFIDAIIKSTEVQRTGLFSNVGNNRFFLNISGQNMTFFIVIDGVTQYSFNFTFTNILLRHKILIKWKNNEIKTFIDGTLVNSVSSFTTFQADTLNQLSLNNGGNGSVLNAFLNSLQIYKTALTDAECITLTTT